jgi:hypothetical protein
MYRSESRQSWGTRKCMFRTFETGVRNGVGTRPQSREAIDIYVNDRLVARGEVVLVEDKLGVTMTEIIKTDR